MPSINNTTNYLIPAAGSTHAVTFSENFTAAPFLIDWRQFRLDDFPFQPQGVYVDNTQGAGPLVITIAPLDYTITVPAGSQLATQFPAPNGQSASVIGQGQATLIFVDYPVLASGTGVNILNVPAVTISGTVDVQPPATAPGALPYQVQEIALPAQAMAGVIAPAATSLTLTPALPNKNLIKARIVFSDNSDVAASVEITLTLTLNGIVIFSEIVYIPGSGLVNAYIIDADFSGVGLNAGAGSLVTTISTALTVGKISVNAYFG